MLDLKQQTVSGTFKSMEKIQEKINSEQQLKENLLEEQRSNELRIVELDQKINAIKTAAINQALLDNNDFDIPKYMHKSEIQNISSQYEGMNQKIDDKIQTELNQIAAKRVKLNLMSY